jgi:hypothetical protein
MSLRRRDRTVKARDPEVQAQRKSSTASDGLEEVDVLLGKSEDFSKRAKTSLEDFGSGIAKISTKVSNDDRLGDVDKLLGKSKDFSRRARVDLEGVGKDVAQISLEAKARHKRLSEQS